MASSARIDELKKKFDENPRRYFAPLANEYRKAGDADQAIAICREFLPQQPGHMSGHIVYGQALFDAQQFEEARTVFDTALTLDPENLIALRSLGDISRNLGDAEGARAWYQRVLDADPRNDEIAAILTELAAVPAAPEPPAAEHAAVETGPSGTVVMGATPLDTPSEAEVHEPAAPAPGDREPAPQAADSGMLEFEPFGAAAAAAAAARPESESESPPPAAAPSAEGLLDIDDLRFEPETPVVPRRSTPHASLHAMGLDIERGDENAFMPGGDATPEAEPPASEAAEAAVGAAPELDGFTFDDVGDSTPDVEAAATPESDPFATETMAELYLSQGHPDDALRVYRQLLAQRPDDAALEAKISSIVMMTAMTPAIPMEAVPASTASAPEAGPAAAAAPPAEAMLEPESVAEPAAVVESEPAPEVESEAEPMSDFDLAVDGEPAGGGEQATGYRAEAELETVVEFEMDSELEPTVEFEMDAEIEAAAEAEVVSDTESGAEMGPEPAQTVPDLDASGFSLETPVEAAAGVPESVPLHAGPSIREFLSSFAVRVPPAWGQAAGTGYEAEAESVEAPEAAGVAPVPIEPDAPVAPTAPAPAPATVDFLAPGATVADVTAPQAGGSIDALFGGGPVATPEQAAAATLAGAFGVAGEEPASPMTGAPARRATEELSLDNVFRESPASPPADAGGFSFDRFFTGGTPAQGTPARETPAESLPPESADADIEQFNSWLEGLKKR